MPPIALDFKGKVVLVTGATRGLGRRMAVMFMEAGAHVIGTGTSEKSKVLTGMEYWPLDLSNEQSIETFLQRLKDLKRLDVLVNNAGINLIEPIDTLKRPHWDKIIQVNLTGAMLLMKEASALMARKKIKGKILNISSILGFIARPKRSSYCASKAGLIGLTHASSLDLAPRGILVNALCPGYVLTDLTKGILSSSEIKQLEQQIPMGRLGSEADIARAALFLCSDLNTYITGQTLVVDGGVSIQ